MVQTQNTAEPTADGSFYTQLICYLRMFAPVWRSEAVMSARLLVMEQFKALHGTSHEGHLEPGRGLIGPQAAHFRQEMTREGKQEEVMLFHWVSFPSVPTPSLAVARSQAWRGKGERVRVRSPPPPPTGGHKHVSTGTTLLRLCAEGLSQTPHRIRPGFFLRGAER